MRPEQNNPLASCRPRRGCGAGLWHGLTCVSVPSRKLTKVLRNYVDNAEKPGINEQLYKAMKALEYIFKFIVRSRVLFNQ